MDDGDVGDNLRRPSAVELEIATRLSSSVARRLVSGAVKTPVHEFDVVIDGSVAQALSSRGREGRRVLLSRGLGEHSLRDIWCDSGNNVAMLTVCMVCGLWFVVV